MTQANPPKTVTPTGFDLMEKLLGEFRDKGKSTTLETWNNEIAARLEAFRAANASPVLLKQAGQIEKAFSSANKLMETIKPKKRPPNSLPRYSGGG
jgi:hypothetical protein